MKHHNVRSRLIDNTITVIATNGLDKTTTKAIVQGTNINEAYIYAHFTDKEDLLAKTFDALDEELLAETMRHISKMSIPGLDFETRCWLYFSSVWEFLLGNRDRCLAFVQYYYSPYFKKHSMQIHKERFVPLVDKLSLAFKEEADVWMILNHMLNVMLDFAIKVYNDEMPSNDNYTEHVFRVIYLSVKQYLKDQFKDLPKADPA